MRSRRNEAADKIWNDHLGNNAYVWHRDQCTTCLAAYKDRGRGLATADCPEGAAIYSKMIDDICDKMDEAIINQN
jgi:hypothetical protein